MRIIHVYDGHERVFPGEGSVPSDVYELAKWTARKGHDVTVLERRWIGTDYIEHIDGVRFVRFDLNVCSNVSNEEIVYEQIRKPSGVLRLAVDRIIFAFKANKYLRGGDFDVIHVHLPFAANVLVNLNRKLRERMIYTAHIGEEKKRLGLASKKETPLLLKLFSPDLYLMKRVKMVTVLNERLRSILISLNKIKPENIVAIPPKGIDIDEFNPNIDTKDVRERYRLSNYETVILFANTITPRKGVEYLVRAANIIVNQFNYKNVLFLLAGRTNLDKEYVDKILKIIKVHKLEENVKLIGHKQREELRALYVASDIFVTSSLEEGFGLSVMEAMSSGKPLIGTNVGGIPMQIKNGWNGFLVEPGNVKQLAEKIRYLIDNPEERKRMGRNSRKLAEEEFNSEKIVGRYLEVYERVVECNYRE